MARIARLTYYPVKSCAGVDVPSAEVTVTGLAHDRVFQVLTPEGEVLTQRRHPVMAVVRPRVLGDRLALSAPGREEIVFDIRRDGPRRPVSMLTWHGEGVRQDPRADEWFSDLFGRPAELVGVTPDHHRASGGEFPGLAAFGDAHALLLASESSLDTLNERIAAGQGEPVPMDRFRPNIVLAGWAEPHREDEARELTAGTVRIGYAERCVRCAVPMVDQETGVKAGPEPIRTLATYRRDEQGGVVFGMKAAVLRPGQVAVGDEVIVHSWAGPSPSTAAAEPPFTATASRPAESV